jgi:Ribbon-helix-helix protein, copG family
MSPVRFTAYLSEAEDKGLRELAEREGTSVNYVVRCAIRIVLGKDVPKWIREEALNEKAR